MIDTNAYALQLPSLSYAIKGDKKSKKDTKSMNEIDENEFWEYAYSDFIDNRNRGALGEFIVAKSLGVTKPPESSWESYDMLSPDGFKVEIKTSGYIQTWHQEKNSIPTFGVGKKLGWKGETNEFDDIKARHADVYVFCLHLEEDKDNPKPLDVENWAFYVVSTELIDEKLEDQQTVRLSTLNDFLGIERISFQNLKAEFDRVSKTVTRR